MAFIHGKGTAVLFNGHNLSGFFNDAGANRSVETAETTVFGKNSKTYIVGLMDGTISLSGLFDGAANAVDAVIQATLGTENSGVTTLLYNGATAGNRVQMAITETTSYDISAPVGDVVSATAELQADEGIDNGIALSNLKAITATGSETSQDNSASTSNGGVAHLHVTANSHNDDAVFKVQHSADDSIWADLVTFTTVATTVTTAQRVVVAAGTTVNRYLRAEYTLAGTGSITFQISFARR
jgi:hypothetical protein